MHVGQTYMKKKRITMLNDVLHVYFIVLNEEILCMDLNSVGQKKKGVHGQIS